MKKIIVFLLIFCIAMPAGAAVSQLEIREIQTHIFETPDTDAVFKAAVNTLQDNGFIIQNIEDNIGYIRAKKDYKDKIRDKKRIILYSSLLAYYGVCTGLSYGLTAGYMLDPLMRLSNEMAPKTVIVDSNVNIEPYGKNATKVRFIIVMKVLENADGYSYIKSSPRQVIRVYDQKVYQEFFNQLDKNIFYENI
ncbi:MAG: hypothetical protein LBK53_05010 [Heliobacteriaceae bacterium]|jgi:hypothetical protein|nr:hypothetical protein [Heliobacteriaceae bacterium]